MQQTIAGEIFLGSNRQSGRLSTFPQDFLGKIIFRLGEGTPLAKKMSGKKCAKSASELSHRAKQNSHLLFEDLLEVKMQCRTCSKSTLKLKASPTTTCQLQPSPMSSSRCGRKHFKLSFVSTYFNNISKYIFKNIRQCQLQLSPVSSSHWDKYSNSWHRAKAFQTLHL